MNDSEKLRANENQWNIAYGDFEGWCALPTWGPFEIGKDTPDLIGEIEDKTFLEVCCGSGHSVKYLLDRGAKKVYAFDFSENQLALAKKLNQNYIEKGKVVFYQSAMEEKINIPELVDVVFSIYGIGWTVAPQKTLSNIYSYLKPRGRFIWSWDHTTFSLAKVKDGMVTIEHSYYNETEIARSNKTFKDNVIYITPRKISTWFSLLKDAGFEINQFLEPEPQNINEDIAAISSKEMANYYNPIKAEKLPITMIFNCLKE